jgi:hypothetical protein
MSKNTTTISLSCVIVLIAIYAYFSPQITMWSIGTAAKSNDVETLKGLIVYDAVKGSLAEDIRGQVVASAMKEMPNNPSAGEEMAKANLLIMPVVEAITLPPNLASMITAGKALENIIPGKVPDANQAQINTDPQVDGRYEGYARFHVSTRPKSEKQDDAVHFFLKRESIMTWKLERIVLPAKSTDILGGIKGKVKPAASTPTPAPSSAPAPAEPPTASTPARKDKSRQAEIEKYLLAKLVGKKNQSNENDVQQVIIEVALENKSGKTIKSVDSKLIINDADGDGRMGIAFSHNQEIAPGSTASYRGMVEVNKNVENDRYVWNTELGKFHTEFETSAIVFSDGTRMEIH